MAKCGHSPPLRSGYHQWIFQRIEAHRITQIIRCEVGIGHRLLDVVMAKYLLQSKDITARHHEVRCEGMPENVHRLPCRQIWRH